MAEDAVALGRRVARRFMRGGSGASATRLVQRESACGSEAPAHSLRPKPSDLAAEMQVEVALIEAPPPAQPLLRSEYTSTPPRITIYTDPLNSLAVAIHANQRFDMMRCDLPELHIAHELFHHLESGQRFGPLTREEVEAAAHSFAKELLGVDFEPQELDALLG